MVARDRTTVRSSAWTTYNRYSIANSRSLCLPYENRYCIRPRCARALRPSFASGLSNRAMRLLTLARTLLTVSIIPTYGYKLAAVVADGTADRGVALCGSGIGISISVNRNPAIRCALVSEPLSAALAREHNDANCIALGARLIGLDMAKACISAFLQTEFAGGRHQRRVDKLSNPDC